MLAVFEMYSGLAGYVTHGTHVTCPQKRAEQLSVAEFCRISSMLAKRPTL